MDFSNRTSPSPAAPASAPLNGGVKRSKTSGTSKWLRWSTFVLLVVVVVLVAAVLVELGIGGPKQEASYVDTGKLQAVFLNTGQVYFGNIKSLNSKYVVLDNIYYLQTTSNGSSSTSSNANTNVQLVKLGCELHAPYDQMVINRDQVTFWENLQDSGQVAKAVSTFEKDNPNGQKCADQSQAGNSTSNGVQGSSSNTNSSSSSTNSTTGNSTNSTTTKP